MLAKLLSRRTQAPSSERGREGERKRKKKRERERERGKEGRGKGGEEGGRERENEEEARRGRENEDMLLRNHGIDQPVIEGSYVGKNTEPATAAACHPHRQYASEWVKAGWVPDHQGSSWVMLAWFLTAGGSAEHSVCHNSSPISDTVSADAVSVRLDGHLMKFKQCFQLTDEQLCYHVWDRSH